MAGGKPNPFDPYHIMHIIEQIGEGNLAAHASANATGGQIASIGINVLS
jgi:hypothetical protein